MKQSLLLFSSAHIGDTASIADQQHRPQNMSGHNDSTSATTKRPSISAADPFAGSSMRPPRHPGVVAQPLLSPSALVGSSFAGSSTTSGGISLPSHVMMPSSSASGTSFEVTSDAVKLGLSYSAASTTTTTMTSTTIGRPSVDAHASSLNSINVAAFDSLRRFSGVNLSNRGGGDILRGDDEWAFADTRDLASVANVGGGGTGSSLAHDSAHRSSVVTVAPSVAGANSSSFEDAGTGTRAPSGERAASGDDENSTSPFNPTAHSLASHKTHHHHHHQQGGEGVGATGWGPQQHVGNSGGASGVVFVPLTSCDMITGQTPTSYSRPSTAQLQHPNLVSPLSGSVTQATIPRTPTPFGNLPATVLQAQHDGSTGGVALGGGGMLTNVYVGHLPADYRDADLKALFSHFGAIVSSKVMLHILTGKSRRFGFVKFDVNEAAQRAILALNGLVAPPRQSLYAQGSEESIQASAESSASSPADVEAPQPLVVRLSDATADYVAPSEGTRKIFVRNVPLDVQEPAILEFFSKFGRVQCISFQSDEVSGAMTSASATTAATSPSRRQSNALSTFSAADCPVVSQSPSPVAVTPALILQPTQIVYITFDTVDAATKAARETHDTLPFPSCRVPVLSKLAESYQQRQQRLHHRVHSPSFTGGSGGATGTNVLTGGGSLVLTGSFNHRRSSGGNSVAAFTNQLQQQQHQLHSPQQPLQQPPAMAAVAMWRPHLPAEGNGMSGVTSGRGPTLHFSNTSGYQQQQPSAGGTTVSFLPFPLGSGIQQQQQQPQHFQPTGPSPPQQVFVMSEGNGIRRSSLFEGQFGQLATTPTAAAGNATAMRYVNQVQPQMSAGSAAYATGMVPSVHNGFQMQQAQGSPPMMMSGSTGHAAVVFDAHGNVLQPETHPPHSFNAANPSQFITTVQPQQFNPPHAGPQPQQYFVLRDGQLLPAQQHPEAAAIHSNAPHGTFHNASCAGGQAHQPQPQHTMASAMVFQHPDSQRQPQQQAQQTSGTFFMPANVQQQQELYSYSTQNGSAPMWQGASIAGQQPSPSSIVFYSNVGQSQPQQQPMMLHHQQQQLPQQPHQQHLAYVGGNSQSLVGQQHAPVGQTLAQGSNGNFVVFNGPSCLPTTVGAAVSNHPATVFHAAQAQPNVGPSGGGVYYFMPPRNGSSSA